MYSNLPERRKFIRRDFSLPMHYTGYEASLNTSVSKDVGEQGIKFSSNKFIPVLTRLMLNVFFQQAEPLKLLGEVVWIRKLPHLDMYSIGTRFVNLSEEQKRNLSEYLDVDIASV
jgi:hypothetical protein